MDNRKLNALMEKDHFPLLFIDQMLNRLAERGWYCFLNGYYEYIKYLSPLKIKIKPYLLILTVHSPSRECSLGYVMPLPYFKDVCCLFLPTWLKIQ